MDEGMNEPKSFPIFHVQTYLELLPMALLIKAQIEGEERAKRMKKAEDFVRRYPMPPKRKRGKA